MLGTFGKYNRISSLFHGSDYILYNQIVADFAVLNIIVNIRDFPLVTLVGRLMKSCEARDDKMLKRLCLRLFFLVYAVSDFSALYINNWMMSVLPGRCGRQSLHMFSGYSSLSICSKLKDET